MPTCHYCEKKEAADESLWYRHKMYYVTKKVIIPVGIEYTSEFVKVPRCKSCEKKHSKTLLPGMIIWLLSTGGLLYYWLRQDDVIILMAIILAVIIGGIVAGGAIWLFNAIFFEHLFKIKSDEDIDDYPPVKAMLDEGWTKNKPDAADRRDARDRKEERKEFPESW